MAVHHSNEIAQSEARHGTRLANFWPHGAFLKSAHGKMAKSDGTFLRLHDLRERGVEPLAWRYLCLTTHYRSQMNFTDEALESAASGSIACAWAGHGAGHAGLDKGACGGPARGTLDRRRPPAAPSPGSRV